MEESADHAACRGPAPARIRSVYAAGLGTYRRRFLRIVFAAMVVFAPIDLVVTLATEAAKDVAENADVLSGIIWVSGTAVSVAGTTLSLVFFAGVIDRIVAVDQQGHDDAPLLRVLRELPTLRLILAAVFATGLILLGLVLLLVPGFIMMVLFAIVGPVVVIEDRRAWASLRRSASLVWPHFWLTVVVVLLPTMLEEEITSSLESFHWYENPLVHLSIDVGSTIFVGGLIGVLEVTLAHALVADAQRRREKRAGLQDPGSPSEGCRRRMEPAAEGGDPTAAT